MSQSAISICSQLNIPVSQGMWDKCHVCALEVFVCDSTREAAIKNYPQVTELIIYCIPCALEYMKNSPFNFPQAFTPEQEREVKLGLEEIWREDNGIL